ncbi:MULTISPECIES: hypothetical protein [Blastopirellula]|uniref:Uncharacterized protein n=1 Tax=Blastopirellula marina DSM 3645 TaxID=314230 RepID=A3ZYN3_9BACT|nr:MULTISPECIES: hypothetical protein [Blastopirellula]EAQ78446.1 hypothetical protein DSM3645_07136 [Blastopirellula marina DSM 3645]UUO05589.1 hypothetical protein M4951_19700 [Blastopirellula sp. J2-11]
MVKNIDAWDLVGNRMTSPRRAVNSSRYVVYLLKTLHEIEQCGYLVGEEADEADLPLETTTPTFSPPVRYDRWATNPTGDEDI